MAKESPGNAPKPSRNPVLIYGDLSRDIDLLRDMRKELPSADHDLHGRLQVMLSAVRRCETAIRELIEHAERQ